MQDARCEMPRVSDGVTLDGRCATRLCKQAAGSAQRANVAGNDVEPSVFPVSRITNPASSQTEDNGIAKEL